MLNGFQRAQVEPDGLRIVRAPASVYGPGHEGEDHGAVGSDTVVHRGHEMILGPRANPGGLIWRKVRAIFVEVLLGEGEAPPGEGERVVVLPCLGIARTLGAGAPSDPPRKILTILRGRPPGRRRHGYGDGRLGLCVMESGSGFPILAIESFAWPEKTAKGLG